VTEELYRKYERLLWNMVGKYWHKFPSYVRDFMSPDDLFEELLVTVIQAVDRFYDPDRAMLSTYIYNVARNHCQSLMIRYTAQKRNGIKVDSDNVFPCLATPTKMAEEQCAAVSTLEEIVNAGSDELRQTVSDWIHKGNRRISKRCASEFRTLARRWNFNAADLGVVLSMI